MDKYKENGILLVRQEVVKYDREVDDMNAEIEVISYLGTIMLSLF